MRIPPDHARVLDAIVDFFGAQPGVVGGFASGSLAYGGMDELSDLDLGIVVEDEAVRERLWESRWDWQIAPWFHRFDADHVRPHFVIYPSNQA